MKNIYRPKERLSSDNINDILKKHYYTAKGNYEGFYVESDTSGTRFGFEESTSKYYQLEENGVQDISMFLATPIDEEHACCGICGNKDEIIAMQEKYLKRYEKYEPIITAIEKLQQEQINIAVSVHTEAQKQAELERDEAKKKLDTLLEGLRKLQE